VTQAIAVLSFEEFCLAEGLGDRRHELVGGRVYAMAGGSEHHDLAAGLLYEAMARNARIAGCRAVLANRSVRTMAGNGYYPDVMVVCGPAAHRLYEQNPTLVVEVLSRSTEDVARRAKAQAYSTSTSPRQYILVDSGDVLDTGYGIVDIDAFHDELDLTATT
jgi:Uma2 family endonuclease